MTHIIITRSDNGSLVTIDGEEIGWAADLPEAHKLIKSYQAGEVSAPEPEAKPKPAKAPAKPKPAK